MKKNGWRRLTVRVVYKHKKEKKNWRGSYTGGRIQTRKRKLNGAYTGKRIHGKNDRMGLTPGEVYKQEKEKLEGVLTPGDVYKQVKEKMTTKKMAKGGLHLA